ncbi:hypothetical protein C8Q78DRAFT_744935 [Trametes maxima]|nr:hypothetical protein C8Q78DRAFT_744935 [Trametes maxima]
MLCRRSWRVRALMELWLMGWLPSTLRSPWNYSGYRTSCTALAPQEACTEIHSRVAPAVAYQGILARSAIPAYRCHYATSAPPS